MMTIGMKNKVKKYLKTKTEAEISEIVKHPDLTNDERWIIFYTFAKDRLVLNTCMKLNISERQYHIIKDQALIKLYYILQL